MWAESCGLQAKMLASKFYPTKYDHNPIGPQCMDRNSDPQPAVHKIAPPGTEWPVYQLPAFVWLTFTTCFALFFSRNTIIESYQMKSRRPWVQFLMDLFTILHLGFRCSCLTFTPLCQNVEKREYSRNTTLSLMNLGLKTFLNLMNLEFTKVELWLEVKG